MSSEAKEDKIKEAIQRARMLASKMGQPPNAGLKRSADDNHRNDNHLSNDSSHRYDSDYSSQSKRSRIDCDRTSPPAPSLLKPPSTSNHNDYHSSSSSSNNNNNNDNNSIGSSSSSVTSDNSRIAQPPALYSNFVSAPTYYGQAEKSAGPVTYQQGPMPSTERLLPHITLQNASTESSDHVRLLPQASYSQSSVSDVNTYGTPLQERIEILVPHNVIGLVIGKGGENIKRIQNDTGATVRVDPNTKDSQGNKMCTISGSADAVVRARDQVNEIIDNAAANKRGPRILQEGQEEFRMKVPAHRTGAIIGRGGETIRAIKQQSMCDIELDKYAKDCSPEETVFIIRGPPSNIPNARELIQAKLTSARGPPSSGAYVTPNNSRPPKGVATGANAAPMASYTNEMSVTSGQHHHLQQQSQQHQQSAGDVAAWQAYYAQYYAYQAGMAGYAGHAGTGEAQDATGANATGAPAATAAGPTAVAAVPTSEQSANSAAGGQADYSAQWAEYYRALGYHKQAEAIEQNMINK